MSSNAEQRNPYAGDPERSWILLRLESKDGGHKEIQLLADTGNPFALILDPDVAERLTQRVAPPVETNFGTLKGFWFELAMPEFGLTASVLGYASLAVAEAAKHSHSDFAGLAGLPPLRLLEYGGNADEFWIRRRA